MVCLKLKTRAERGEAKMQRVACCYAVAPVTSTGKFSTNKILLGIFCCIGAEVAEEEDAEGLVAVAFCA